MQKSPFNVHMDQNLKKNQVFQTKTCLDGGPLDMVLLEFLEIHCTPAEKINFGLDSPSQSVKVVKLSEFEKYISCFVTVEPPWRIFFTFMKMLPNVSFISMVIKKSVFVSINSHNLNFSTEMHSLKV